MNLMLHPDTQAWVERLGWTLVHFLWQGAMIAGLYAAVRRGMQSPRSRYALGCAALAAMLIAPAVTFLLTVPAKPVHVNPYVGVVPAMAPDAIAHFAPQSMILRIGHHWRDYVMPWLVLAWLAGAIGFSIRLLGGWMVALRMRSILVRPVSRDWQELLDGLRKRLRVSRPVRLLNSALAGAPMVVGWLRPVILMPIGALAGIPREHVEALLAHELAHIRRHDYLVNVAQGIAEALLFYHPAVWWISGHIREEREMCCDDAAVAIHGDAVVYARVLANLEAWRPDNLSTALGANGGSLLNRIARLLNLPARQARSLPGPGAAVATILIVVACGLLAQVQNARPLFEAVTIKPNNLGGGHVHMHNPPGRLEAQMTIKDLIEYAYGIKEFQVSGGPPWMGQQNYDFEGTTGKRIEWSRSLLEPYLQSLLADRFQLKFHRETKEGPVYALVVAKRGSKLTPSTSSDGTGTDSNGDGAKELMTGKNLTLAGFADFLARRMDRPVIDETGMAGKYDFRLEWSPDQSEGVSVFTALQDQLGLKLNPSKGPIETLVVDSVEKPSEN